jgi:hypothetical protein
VYSNDPESLDARMPFAEDLLQSMPINTQNAFNQREFNLFGRT